MIKTFKKYLKRIRNPLIEYWNNDQKKSEKYYLNGKLHREDGPAYQSWYDNGQKQSEIYYLNDNLHREDGPAVQGWYRNGQKEFEKYHLYSKLLHREDGPAYQAWYKNGQKNREDYYLNGQLYSKKEWIDKLKEIGSPHYKEQKIKYDIKQYNL